jgi:hypothetical protein
MLPRTKSESAIWLSPSSAAARLLLRTNKEEVFRYGVKQFTGASQSANLNHPRRRTMRVVVQATHDFHANDGALRTDAPQLLSFSRGTLLQIMSSNNGWSYGSILRRPEDPPLSNDTASITGWFPSSYVTNYVTSSSPPSITNENDIWNRTLDQSLQHSSVFPSTSAAPVNVPRPPPVVYDDDDGFNAIPMGYDEPQSYEEQRNPLPYRPEEEPADEPLPEGVQVVPVPGRRHLHSYIPLAGGRKLMQSLHQNAVQPIVTKCSRKKKDAPLRPSVFISP